MFKICITCNKEFKTSHSGLKNCSRTCSSLMKQTSYRGRTNPNCKYETLDESFFENVDSEFKAYFLGWLASDSSIAKGAIQLYIKDIDLYDLQKLKNNFCKELVIKKRKMTDKTTLVGFTISSMKIVEDVCKLLQIGPGAKFDKIKFPMIEEKYYLAFIRGFFDGDGCIVAPNVNVARFDHPRCSFSSTSAAMRDSIAKILNIPCSNSGVGLYYSGNNALNLMSKLYDGAEYRLTRKYDMYLDWCLWVPCLSGSGRWQNNKVLHEQEGILFARTDKSAVIPTKANASDSGYDLTLIKVHQDTTYYTMYDTGIRVMPPFGWYFDMVPRSSIIKTGHMLANSVGIIDRTYTGTILVPLIKVHPGVPTLDLPAKVVQLILRPIIHINFIEVDSLEKTSRGDGGFGSTGVV